MIFITRIPHTHTNIHKFLSISEISHALQNVSKNHCLHICLTNNKFHVYFTDNDNENDNNNDSSSKANIRAKHCEHSLIYSDSFSDNANRPVNGDYRPSNKQAKKYIMLFF